MAFRTAHGLKIADNGYIQNLTTEGLAEATETSLIPSYSGRIFYSVKDKCLKTTRQNADNSGYEIVPITTGDAASALQVEVDAIESTLGSLISSSGSYQAFTGTNYVNGNTSLYEDLIDLDTAIKTVSDSITPVQSELDTTQTGAGLGTDGTYQVNATANYIQNATSLADADTKLDTSLKTLYNGVTDLGSTIGQLDAIINTTQAGAGLNEDGTYIVPTESNYLNSATSLADADAKLDAAIKSASSGSDNVQSELDTLETSIGGIVDGNGNFIAPTTTNYLNETTSITNAFSALDTQVKTNETNIASEVTARTNADSTIQLELDAVETSLGSLVSEAGAYVPVSDKNYINNNTSISEDIIDLDAAIKVNADALSALGTGTLTDIQNEVDAIESAVGISTDGSFSAFSGTNYIDASTSITNSLVLTDTKLKSTSDIADAALPKAGGIMTGDIDMAANKITSSYIATSNYDIPNKLYVDTYIQGASWKNAVEVVSSNNIVLSGLQTIDGVTLEEYDRVLLIGQTVSSENGIYVASADAWARAVDFDGNPDGEVKPGCMIPVSYGTINGGHIFAVTGSSTPVVGTDPITFVRINSVSDIIDGDGLTKNGNELSVNVGAGVIILPEDQVGIDVYANKGLILTEDGTTSSTSENSKLAILVDSSLEFDGTTGALKVAGAATGAITTELDQVETSLGLNEDGTLVDFTGNYTTGATTVVNAIGNLDTQVKTNETNITSEVTARTNADSTIQLELDTTQTGAGLGTDGTYVVLSASNYLTTATSLSDADSKLDVAIKTNETGLASAQTEIDNLETTLGGIVSATGTFVPFTTTNYLNSATDTAGLFSALDIQVKSVADDLATLSSNSGDTYASKTAYNATIFTFDSSIAAGGSGPALTHTVTHNLATSLIDVAVWVKDEDDKYKNDLVAVTINSDNDLTVDMTESRDIRVVVRSAISLS